MSGGFSFLRCEFKIKMIRAMILSLMLLALFVCPGLNARVFPELQYPNSRQTEMHGIPQLIQQLYSNDTYMRDDAKKKLVMQTKKSAGDRRRVIHSMIRVLDDPTASFETQSDVAGTLGQLRAIEGIDALVKYLDLNNGVVGLSAGNYPALRAIIEIGRPAVGKLSKALLKERTSVRRNAALALGEIGGGQAKKALELALARESDYATKQIIKIAWSHCR